MPWLAGIGVAVAGAFGASVAATSLTAMVVGGMVVGAAVGGLYAAVTGGNILKGVLYGAVGGAVVGGGAYAMGYGGYGVVSSESMAVPISGATSVGAGENAAMAAAEASQSGGILGGGGGVATKTTAEEGFKLFSAEGMYATGAASSLGGAFLKGGAEGDANDKSIAASERMQSEKLAADKEIAKANNEAALAQAEIAAGSADARNKSAEKMAAADLEFNKEKFSKEFSESQWRDRTDREEKETARQRFETGLGEASKYVAGNTKVVNLVESSRRRKQLPSPAWYGAATGTATGADASTASTAQQQAQPQPSGILGAA